MSGGVVPPLAAVSTPPKRPVCVQAPPQRCCAVLCIGSGISAARSRSFQQRFGQFLPALRRRTNEDIAREGLGKERVLAVVVRLINDLYFRVGSEQSVKHYRPYGVTTLRNRPLEIKSGGHLLFNFVGKHHVRHRVVHVDEELAGLMQDIKKIGGARLFGRFGCRCLARIRVIDTALRYSGK